MLQCPILCLNAQMHIYFFISQIDNLEREIREKRRHMRALEQKLMESGEASVANASMMDMQQVMHPDFIVPSFLIFMQFFSVQAPEPLAFLMFM